MLDTKNSLVGSLYRLKLLDYSYLIGDELALPLSPVLAILKPNRSSIITSSAGLANTLVNMFLAVTLDTNLDGIPAGILFRGIPFTCTVDPLTKLCLTTIDL